MAIREPSGRFADFFVSYSPADERWASWIAWQLEAAGYRVLVQAWDFVAGTNFLDYMDRGVSESHAVIAVLSRNYMRSRFGRIEWQAAMRAAPDDPSAKLITVRIEDCPLDGLLAAITYVDLVGVKNEQAAGELLMNRIRQAMAGRAKPAEAPGYPAGAAREQNVGRPVAGAGSPSRRRPVIPPAYPATPATTSRDSITLLHVSGPRFGRGLLADDEPADAADLQARIWGDMTRLGDIPRPDLLMVSGNLTESGSRREFGTSLEFLNGLRALLGLEPGRVVVIPGPRDVTRAACRAYFADCEADDVLPQPPFWPKWRHFGGLFGDLYQGLDDPVFDSSQPWTLFPIPDLRVVVAGLNSTMAESHRDTDHFGQIGEAQAAWFAERLTPFEAEGWLRIGVIAHSLLPGDPAALRDRPVFESLLAHRLNAVVTGEPVLSLTALSVSGAEDDPPRIPSPAAGHHQIIDITPAGLTRWIRGTERDPVTIERRWDGVAATFQAETPMTDDAEPPPDAPAERVADPTTMLLDRIAEACATRFDRAKIRRIAADVPYLMVTSMEDGFVRQFRVGAQTGGVTADDFESFWRNVHADGSGYGAELVYEGPAPARSLRDEALRRGVRIRSFTEFQGLLDLSDHVAEQTAGLNADRRYPPGLYVPQRFRAIDRPEMGVSDDLVEEILSLVATDTGRFVLLLGDFGRGKTFAMHEVARRIATELPHLVPILIELHRLDKSHTVDGLVAAHLANHGEEIIDLKAFHYMLEQGRIVLLFDGFDELVTRVTYAQAADHLGTLLQAARGKAKIVVTSRTQYFESTSQVFTALGERVNMLPTRRLLTLESFSPAQIRQFLRRRYGDDELADARWRALGDVDDLFGLAENPRMLGFIADLPADRLDTVARSQRTVSAADLYREILDAWLAVEERRASSPGSPNGLSREHLWTAVRALALRLWATGRPYLRPGELGSVAQALTGMADTQMSVPELAHSMGAGSLLVRTDDGLFGFIHASVGEWLVAEHFADVFGASGDPVELHRQRLSALMVEFLCDLAETRAVQAWAGAVLTNPGAGDVARDNAIKITTRLRTPADADLRGANLAGQDLSYRDLQRIDLTGADLTDARLIETVLSGAVLRDATLDGARMDGARMVGADLRGANFTRARMYRADLREADITGSRWSRASLVDVAGADRLAGRREMYGAAIVPGQTVETQFAPSVVSVPYGFHFQTSRLPAPLAYSPDGDVLVIGCEDGTVLVCSGSTGRPIRTLDGHHARTYAVTFRPVGTGEPPGDAGLLATGSADGTVRLWDVGTGHCRHILKVHSSGVWPVVFGPDGGSLATGSADGLVRLWDPATGELLHTLSGHTAPIYTISYGVNRLTVITGDASATVREWDLRTGELLRTWPSAGRAVYRIVHSPDGSLLAAAYADGTVRLWDADDLTLRHELAGHTGRVYAMAFHPSGRLLATGDTEGSVIVWPLPGPPARLPGGAEPPTARRYLTGHKGAVYHVEFSPDGAAIATCDSDGGVRFWDTATGSLRHALTGHTGAVWPFAFHPNGEQIATCGNDGTTRLWDTATGQNRTTLRGHGRRITTVRFSPTGAMLAASGNDGVIRLWDPRTGRRIDRLTGIADQLISVVFNPAGDQLATASNDGGIYLWRAGTATFEREIDADTDHVWAVEFSPDGQVIASANDDDTVRLWYPLTGRLLANLADHHGRVRSIAFSPDGRRVATGCDDRNVRIWSVEGDLLATLAGHTDRVYTVAFDPSGERLASVGNDGTARVWNATTGECERVLAGHTGRLWCGAFHPRGDQLATAGDDLVIRLWDPVTGKHLHTLAGHTRRVGSLAYSPDGGLLASGGDDGMIILWDLSGEAPRRHVTMLGLAEGWAALSPDGRYKMDGEVVGQYWYAVGMCRFEPGDLDPYLSGARRLPLDAPF